MAEAGASGGVKVPMRVALDLVADTTKMLARDGDTRSMLLGGLRAVPLRTHVAEACSIAVMILGMTVGKWWRASPPGRALRKWWVETAYALRRAFAARVKSDLPPRADSTGPADAGFAVA